MPDPTLIVALTSHTEAEPVLVELLDETVVLTLDDGQTLQFDATELRAALSDDGQRQAA